MIPQLETERMWLRVRSSQYPPHAGRGHRHDDDSTLKSSEFN
jgi:hypothetical protein